MTISSPGLPGPSPPPQIWHSGDVFVMKRKQIFEKRGKRRKALFIDRFFIEHMVHKIVFRFAGVIPRRWHFVLCLATTNDLDTFWKWNHHLSACSQRLLLKYQLACNYKRYGFQLLKRPILVHVATYARRIPHCSRWESYWLPSMREVELAKLNLIMRSCPNMTTTPQVTQVIVTYCASGLSSTIKCQKC